MSETIKLSKLKKKKGNPRIIRDERYEKLLTSIKEFPKMLELRPMVYDPETMEVLGGNMRLKALKELKYTEIPTSWVRSAVDLTEEEKKRFIIVDNVGFGEWDKQLLTDDWDSAELDSWGLDIEWGEDEEEIEGGEEETEIPEPPKEPFTKRGDVWELGVHRLMCGDSTSVDDVDKLMNGEKADMVFTDPPYGMKKEGDGVLNDNLNFDDLLAFNLKWIPLSLDNIKDVSSWYCWGIDEPLMDIYSEILKPMAKNQEITFRNLITWDKGNGQGQLSDKCRMYPTADEKCLFIMKGVQGFNNNADNYFEGFEPIRKYLYNERKKSGLSAAKITELTNTAFERHSFTRSQWAMPTEESYVAIQEHCKGEAFKKEYEEIKKEYEEIKKEYEEIKKEYYNTRAYFNNTHDNMNNVWHFKRTGSKEREYTGDHATPKPIDLCSRAIKSSSREKETVLDLFGGSGSTLVSCEKENRESCNMELGEGNCDVIVNRYINYMNDNNRDFVIKLNGEVVSEDVLNENKN